MGELEKYVRKRVRIARVQKVILLTIAAVGVLSSPMAASIILRELRKSVWKSTKRNPKYTINDSLKRLIKSRLLFFEENDRGKFLALTDAGRTTLRRISVSYSKQKSKRWDKKWRIVIFDIREERRGLRIKLRQALNNFGFIRLQDSVWIYPYDCEDFITLLKADFKVGKDVLYIIADRVENDALLLRQFGLAQ